MFFILFFRNKTFPNVVCSRTDVSGFCPTTWGWDSTRKRFARIERHWRLGLNLHLCDLRFFIFKWHNFWPGKRLFSPWYQIYSWGSSAGNHSRPRTPIWRAGGDTGIFSRYSPTIHQYCRNCRIDLEIHFKKHFSLKYFEESMIRIILEF